MTDIIVTTPRSKMRLAALEAEQCKQLGGGYYFRAFHNQPRIKPYEKVWYVEDGYIRGYAVVCDIVYDCKDLVCETSGERYYSGSGGIVVIMRADSWMWVKPERMKGFQNWRYFLFGEAHPAIGGWLDLKPEVNK